MNIVIIPGEWRISSDVHSWQVEQHAPRKDGKKPWKPVSWHPSFESALRALGNRLVRASEAQTLGRALADVDRIVSRLVAALPVDVRLTLSRDIKVEGES